MPTVYRIRCSRCFCSPNTKDRVAGYVAMDDGRGDGAILPEGYWALKIHNEEFVCVAHPVEMQILKEHGYTWGKARRLGRLYFLNYKFCSRCGCLHEEMSRAGSMEGCSVTLCALPAGVLFTHFAASWPWGKSFVGGYLAMLLMASLLGLINYLWHWKENENSKLVACKACGETTFIKIKDATKSLQPCPNCKATALICEVAGIS